MTAWIDRQNGLARIAAAQLFFVGGAPRSGTTWLQSLLDSHPEIRCGGEGLFQKHLAEPLDRLIAERRKELEAKNKIFPTGGFPLPDSEDADILAATGILLGLARMCTGKAFRAVGEKTPENVFFFPRLKQIFPDAKLIAIARDPRDVLTSAWHFFHKTGPGNDGEAAKFAFIRLALPSLNQGARTTLALAEQFPAGCLVVTYERLRAAPETEAARLFGFLGVSTDAAVVADCVARTSFAALSGGRPAGEGRDGTFYRKGVAGDWRSTFTDEMSDFMLQELGWMFPRFGWRR